MGRGVRVKKFTPKDSYLCEYKGERVTAREGKRREVGYGDTPACYMYYFKTKAGDMW